MQIAVDRHIGVGRIVHHQAEQQRRHGDEQGGDQPHRGVGLVAAVMIPEPDMNGHGRERGAAQQHEDQNGDDECDHGLAEPARESGGRIASAARQCMPIGLQTAVARPRGQNTEEQPHAK
jgi:hypothetical protein